MTFDFGNINLTPLIEAIIVLLSALITRRLIPMIKAKTSYENQKRMLAVVDILVYSAEQLYGAGHGEEKLAYVEEELLKRGYEIDRAAIEAAVYDSMNQFKEAARPEEKPKEELEETDIP